MDMNVSSASRLGGDERHALLDVGHSAMRFWANATCNRTHPCLKRNKKWHFSIATDRVPEGWLNNRSKGARFSAFWEKVRVLDKRALKLRVRMPHNSFNIARRAATFGLFCTPTTSREQ
jgi:hypothetical protein